MATLAETSEGVFFIDPGAALAPWRYGLPPHEVEVKALEEFLNKIYAFSRDADYFIVTHYHRDHYLYRRGEEDLYRGKVLYAKNPYVSTNWSQRTRAYTLLKKLNVESLAKRVEYVDGRTLELGRVKVIFSPPLPHGDCGTKLGWVLAVTLEEDGYVFTHASDVQGCVCKDSLIYLGSVKHDLLVISGPPTYLEPEPSIPENTVKLLMGLKEGSTLVIDHHFLRDREYTKYMEYLRNMRRGVKVLTAAEFMGLEVRQLEAYRDVLWGRRSGGLERGSESEE